MECETCVNKLICIFEEVIKKMKFPREVLENCICPLKEIIEAEQIEDDIRERVAFRYNDF